MLILLSPSKKLEAKPPRFDHHTHPVFADKTSQLLKKIKELDAEGISRLMKISSSIAELNYQRFQDFSFPLTKDNAHPALYFFSGDAFNALNVEKLSEQDVLFAQDHLRILSGFYGILRPLDLISAYRLEMGSGLKLDGDKKTLYDFWQTSITAKLNEEFEKIPPASRIIINLASKEYARVIQSQNLNATMITIGFLEQRNEAEAGNVLKSPSWGIKKLRGLVALYILKNRLSTLDGVQGFSGENYRFSPPHSDQENFIFVKEKADLKAELSAV